MAAQPQLDVYMIYDILIFYSHTAAGCLVEFYLCKFSGKKDDARLFFLKLFYCHIESVVYVICSAV